MTLTPGIPDELSREPEPLAAEAYEQDWLSLEQVRILLRALPWRTSPLTWPPSKPCAFPPDAHQQRSRASVRFDAHR